MRDDTQLTGMMLVHAGSCVCVIVSLAARSFLGVPFFSFNSLFLMVLVLINRLFQTVCSVVLVYFHPVDYSDTCNQSAY